MLSSTRSSQIAKYVNSSERRDKYWFVVFVILVQWPDLCVCGLGGKVVVEFLR